MHSHKMREIKLNREDTISQRTGPRAQVLPDPRVLLIIDLWHSC